MYQFFVRPEQIEIAQKRVLITGNDVNHIRNVLRMKVGEEIAVSNGEDGKEYRCGILELTENEILCELRFIKEDAAELPCEIVLYQGLPKSDKMELIVQKCVELGATRIVPVEMKRCVMQLEPKKAASRIARWQSIAEAAAKQSKRAIIPEVSMPMPYKLAIAEAEKQCDICLVPYELAAEGEGSHTMEETRTLLSSIMPGQRVAVFIGPEGGFDEKEIEAALEKGMKPITLGRRILRTETAGLTVLSWLVYLLEQA